eukprot:10036966-Karenia_brevis.AAC.1
MVPKRRICQLCDSMLCAPCVEIHTYQVAARGMTYCQPWSYDNNLNVCPAGRANDDTEGKFKDPNSQ